MNWSQFFWRLIYCVIELIPQLFTPDWQPRKLPKKPSDPIDLGFKSPPPRFSPKPKPSKPFWRL